MKIWNVGSVSDPLSPSYVVRSTVFGNPMLNLTPLNTKNSPPKIAGREIPPAPHFPHDTRLMLQCLFGLPQPAQRPLDAKINAMMVGRGVPRS